MPMDLNKLKDMFLIEATHHVELMNKALVKFEEQPENKSSFHQFYRSVHTLKSLAGTMNYWECMNLCHAMEDVLEAIRDKKVTLTQCADTLFSCLDYLTQTLNTIAADGTEIDAKQFVKKLAALVTYQKKPKKSISVDKFTENAIIDRPLKTIDVKVDRLDLLMNMTEELLVNKMRFDSLKNQIDNPDLTVAVEELNRLLSELQYQIMQIRLVPIGAIFNRFLRMVRDLGKQQHKKITLKMEGSDIELDRLLIDVIGESISHLIKNAIDHGIETPEIRIKNNKLPEGTLLLRAHRTKDTAVIEVVDDGQGVDLQQLRKIALQHQLVQPNATDKELLDLIFFEFSTKEFATPLSGRGIGLPIVKQKISSMGGLLKVETTKGQGTRFIMEVPLSLAIIKTLFVQVADEVYAIPIDVIERLLMVNESDFKGMLQYNAFIFEEHSIPLLFLSKLFEKKSINTLRKPVVVIRRGDTTLGLVVDDLLSTQEVVVKPLNKIIRNNKFFSGAALMGSGQIVLILDIVYILQAFHHPRAKTSTLE